MGAINSFPLNSFIVMPIGITVVIPSLNQGEFIADSLQSLIVQQLHGFMFFFV
jgi:hypothetical protein